MEFVFRLAEDSKDRDKLARFLLQYPFDYPYYGDWVDKALEDLKQGWKTCILAVYNGKLMADLVSQPYKDFPDFLCELKNARVVEEFKRWYALKFMIRVREKVAEKEGYKAMICDTRSDNLPVIDLLLTSGYNELVRASLYDGRAEDVIFVKPLGRLEEELFVPIKQKIILNAA